MIYSIVAALVLILDQAVKLWTTNNIPLGATGEDCVQLIPGVLHMTNVHNTGAAFSILANATWFLVAVSVLFIIGIIVLINMEIINTKFGRWTAVLVMAGALGNAIDRVFYHYVVDMFEIELFSFAVFNVADIFITVCGILFCIHVIVYRDPAAATAAPKKAKQPKQPKQARVREAEPEEDLPAEPARGPRKSHTVKPREKDDPYANIPRRGEHRTLADELRLADPGDPFAEWDLDGTDEAPKAKAAPRRVPEKPEAPAPRRQKAAPVEPDDWDEPEIPAPRKAAPKTPAMPAAPAPKAPALDLEEYSLEDILSEFRDI